MGKKKADAPASMFTELRLSNLYPGEHEALTLNNWNNQNQKKEDYEEKRAKNEKKDGREHLRLDYNLLSNRIGGGALAIHYNISDLPIYIQAESLSSIPGYRTAVHRNDDLESVFMANGSMYVIINGKEVLVKEGELCIISPGSLHYFAPYEGQDCTYYCGLANESLFSAEPSLVKQYIMPLFHAVNPTYAILKSDDRYFNDIIDVFYEINQLAEERPHAFELLITAKFHEYLAYLVAALPDAFFNAAKEDSEEAEAFYRMLIFINQNYGSHIMVNDIADAGLVSKKHCYQLFDRFAGRTPLEFLGRYRLREAKRLLKNTTMPIAQIADECGFTHQSHFTNCFSKMYKTTPKKYREEL